MSFEYSRAFLRAVNFILSDHIEGGLSLDPNDRGNWTSGKPGEGELAGTKWGISAAQYPALDIRNMRREDAVSIYWEDYWNKIKGDELPPRVAFVVFDSAVNQGVETAAKLLQASLGVTVDGVIGPITVGATRVADEERLVVEFLARRGLRYARGDKAQFERFGLGWFKRLFYAAVEVQR